MDLIKSLFLPSKMNRHRHMNGFMAVMIFLACAFVLTIPTTVRIEKEKYNLVDEFGMSFLTEIPNTEDTNKIMQLKDYGCSVKEGKLVCENEEIIPIAKKDDAVKEAFMISYVVKVAQKTVVLVMLRVIFTLSLTFIKLNRNIMLILILMIKSEKIMRLII